MKQQYRKDINAPAQRVYRTMLGLDNISTYEQWTAQFHPTSTYEGNWEKGTRMYFVGTDEKGQRGGMISEIAENIPNRFVSIRHIGMLQNGKEMLEGPEVEPWAGMLEDYAFEEADGVTTVIVEMDVVEEYAEHFDTTWPKALGVLKELSENG